MGKMTFKHEMLSEPTFAFVDIETTGGNAQRDRITEIGIRFWRVPHAELPKDQEQRRQWLNQQWSLMQQAVEQLVAHYH